MKLILGKPTYPRKELSSKYQIIFDSFHEITREEALIVECEKDETPTAVQAGIRNYLWKIKKDKKYSVLLRQGNKIYIQLREQCQ